MTTSRRRPATRRGPDAGQSTVEFAIVFPIVVIAVLAVLQIGLIVRDQLAVGMVARDAARAAAVTTDLGSAAATAEAGTGVDGIDVSVVERGDTVVATATKRGATAVPMLGGLVSHFALTSTATMLIEPPP